MNRRNFLWASSAVALAGFSKSAFANEGEFEVTRTEAEWRALLTDIEYSVMREEDTERPGSSPLNNEKREGTFACKGCDLPLYPSYAKYNSGTGWPSFYEAMDDAVKTKKDVSLWGIRTELHCRRCGSHLGHVFNDGPQPTGKRHCINGVSLKFQPKEA